MRPVEIHEIIRTRRKTIALVITPDARLVVRAPLTASVEYIKTLVERKKSWIIKKQELVKSCGKTCKSGEVSPGGEYLFLGGKYRLEFSDLPDCEIRLEGNSLILPQSLPAQAAGRLKEWYVSQAGRILEGRVELYSRKSGYAYKSVRITDARRRWGSCGHNSTLNFTWRLIMAPLYVVDYVVVHELVHVAVKNHSRAFWARVEGIMPDFAESRKWLRQNRDLMELL